MENTSSKCWMCYHWFKVEDHSQLMPVQMFRPNLCKYKQPLVLELTYWILWLWNQIKITRKQNLTEPNHWINVLIFILLLSNISTYISKYEKYDLRVKELVLFLPCLFLHVYHTLILLRVNWFQCSSTKKPERMVQLQYAWKMRNSPPFPAIYCKTFSTKCSKRSHYTTEVKIFAFITHLFEHWPHQQPARCSVCGNHSCAFACHHFQIIYQLQLTDSSCHHSALWTL